MDLFQEEILLLDRLRQAVLELLELGNIAAGLDHVYDRSGTVGYGKRRNGEPPLRILGARERRDRCVNLPRFKCAPHGAIGLLASLGEKYRALYERRRWGNGSGPTRGEKLWIAV